jgi:hypothetical protein
MQALSRAAFRVLYFVIPLSIVISIVGTLCLNVVVPWQARHKWGGVWLTDGHDGMTV